MLKLKVAEQVDLNGWDSLVSQFRGSIFLRPESLSMHGSGYRPSYFTYHNDSSDCVGIAFGALMRPQRPLARLIFRSLYCPTLPVSKDGSTCLVGEMIQQMIAYGRAQKVTSISIDSFYAQTAYEHFKDLGFKTQGRWEFLLDLRPHEDEIWARMDPHHKRYAKYGERHGLSVSEDNSSEGIDRLVELQQYARSRTQRRGGDYDLPSYEAYLSLKRHLLDRGYGALYVAVKDGVATSALLVSTYNSRAYLIFAGTSPEGYQMRAPIFLFWNTAVELKRRGIVEWNLGGVPRQAEHETSQSHGLFTFKKRFGAEKVACISAEMHAVNKPRALLYAFVRAIRARV